MKWLLLLCLLCLGFLCAKAQTNNINVKTEKVQLQYQNQTVKARKLTVSSEIPMPIEAAWANAKTPALLQFVAKGMMRFKPAEGAFPAQWQQGQTFAAKMYLFGLMPYGGTHYLDVETIDDQQYYIKSKEWNNSTKVWNHEITLTPLENGNVLYTDTIEIYAGLKTGFVAAFAKRFYKHRQKRWQLVAAQGMNFGPNP